MDALKVHNKLKYALPSNLNVVERRQNKVSFADQNSYTSTSGNELVIRFTNSTDYVYGPNSYLTFDVQCAGETGGGGPDPTGFAKGTALSLFSRMLFEDRSGAELERNDSFNRYCFQTLPWKWSGEYVKNGPAMAGQYESMDVNDSTAAPPTYLSNGSSANYNCYPAKLTVCIPLRYFLGIFSRETLIPNTLLSGALLRLQLESSNDALVRLSGSTSTAMGSYTITNPRVVCDSMSLSPVIQKNLMEQSQSGGGLDFVYETAYYQSGNPGTSTNYNLQVNKAVSRAQKLFWGSRYQATTSNITKENLGTERLAVSQLDYRLGDLYFPQRIISVTGTAQKNGAELYQNSLQSMNRMKCNRDPPSISKNEFCNSGTALTATPLTDNNNNGRAVHVQSFEQSSALEYSGLAINNSRTLEARIVFANGTAARTIDSWLSYVKVAKCNQLRAIIKE
jgi:hypothetical protein